MKEGCGIPGCIGFHLLHPVELSEVNKLKERHIKKNPDATFVLIESPSSGEVFIKFHELHVIHPVEKKEEESE